MAGNKFDHQMDFTISQAQAEHLIELLMSDLRTCADIPHMQTYMPLLDALVKQFKEQKP